MRQKNQLTIKEFSLLTGINRDNLRFYDKIGLLSPETRDTYNNYRYYSKHQVDKAYLIASLRGIGVGIQDIKKYAASPTSDNTLALFEQQDAHIEKEIRCLQEMRLIMHLYADMVKDAVKHADEIPFLEERACEPFFLCPMIPDDMDGDEAIISAYDYAEQHGVNLGFPSGTLVPREKLGTDNVENGGGIYFKTEDKSNAHKPKGMYAIVYGKCMMWRTEPIYKRLLTFIEEQKMTVLGDAYEEYLIGFSISDTKGDYVRIEIPVICKDVTSALI